METQSEKNLIFSWESEVRDSELDSQGIVNNACYFVYMEHCRHLHLSSLGLDFFNIKKAGIDLLVRDCQIRFRASLTSGDHFIVNSSLELKKPFKIIVPQEVIRKSDNKLVVNAVFTVTGINRHSNQIELPEELVNQLQNIE